TDTPIELINGDSDFENQRTRDTLNPREFQRSIESFLDKKFSQMENRRQRDREIISSQMKQNKKPNINFKYKNNKIQFSFLNEVLDLAKEAKDLLECDSSRKRLASTLEDLTNTITKRQKVIRLADKSSGGWNTVDEYL
ncbi:MAG: hypothetical protein AAFY76_24015, partial [Cyanobacteria bacterium J06649_11]